MARASWKVSPSIRFLRVSLANNVDASLGLTVNLASVISFAAIRPTGISSPLGAVFVLTVTTRVLGLKLLGDASTSGSLMPVRKAM